MNDSFLHHGWGIASTLITGAGLMRIVAGAVNSFPTKDLNQYQLWFLGVIQMIVGQVQNAKNTFSGADTATIPVVPGTGDRSPLDPIPLKTMDK